MSVDLDNNPFRSVWEKKSIKQIEKEIESRHKWMDKNSSAYAWHGKNMTNPNELSDGDKFIILREILDNKRGINS